MLFALERNPGRTNKRCEKRSKIYSKNYLLASIVFRVIDSHIYVSQNKSERNKNELRNV